ncbi:hypothetical protein MSAN_01235900 [Mycena sanguinolenta]|uniref:Uncharacterized protein n=1 Tax=Mycena sanguinolenta TaxID=230812 RepID=A0A8H6YJA6_9AGAR|nr:hypothetical protein MSAN_01235900 [Mycena sanguinolenta]
MERVPALWFPDGNLVICAGSVLFRASTAASSQPARPSLPIYSLRRRTLQRRKRTGEDAETLDGCPVLHLDDSAADTMYFLKAIFDYEFFAPYPAHTDFDAIHGILRLGTKYRVAPLRRRALRHLSSAHPTRLGAWDALCGVHPSAHAASPSSAGTGASGSAAGSAVVASGSAGGGGSAGGVGGSASAPNGWVGPYFGPSFDPAHLELPILTLARAARAPWVLPAAFLRAAAAAAGGVLGSLDVLEGIDYTGVHVELERGDKVVLLEAGTTLLGEGTSELLGFLWSPTVCPGCVYAQPGAAAASTGPNATAGGSTAGTNAATAGVMNPCTANRLAMRVAAERWRSDALLPIAVASGWRGGERSEFHEYADERDYDRDHAADGPSGSAAASTSGNGGRAQDEEGMDEDEEQDGAGEEEGRAIWGEEDFARLSVCAPCLAYMKADWAARRARFWDRLPGVFGLPSWAELERERRRQEAGLEV